MGLGPCRGALDFYWGEGAFGPFQFKQLPWGLWTCSEALSLQWDLGLAEGEWSCIGTKGPSAPSNLNSLLGGFEFVVGPWACSVALGL